MRSLIKPRIMPYGLKLTFKESDNLYHMHRWCEKEIGKFDRNWTSRSYGFRTKYGFYQYATIYFQNEVDAVGFKLRWI